MTAPNRIHGKTQKEILNGCNKKRRYSDEFGCRSAGQVLEEQNKIKLYLYRCDICKGWHLTHHKQKRGWQAVSYMFENSLQKAA